MLAKIFIKNYVIIDELTIQFDDNLNVITGETGAGKSIILGALSLILGDRADSSVLIDPSEKCVIEAYFNTEKNAIFNQYLEEEELDKEPTTIIRREVSASGKSRAFINDTPVTLAILNKLTGVLVDLHRQFDNKDLLNDHFAIEVLDALAHNNLLLNQYKQHYANWQKLVQQHKLLLQQQHTWTQEFEYKQFLFNELEDANFSENELEEANEQLSFYENAEQIMATLQAADHLLESGDFAINNEIKKLANQFAALKSFATGITIGNRLESIYLELKDITAEVVNQRENVLFDPEQLQQLQEKLDLGYKLFKKHNVSTTAELIHIHKDLAAALNAVQSAEEQLATLADEIMQAHQNALSFAQQLTQNRQSVIPTFTQNVNRLLSLVGMPNAVFFIQHETVDQLNAFGENKIELQIDTNKSGKFAPVHKSASGGELSRIMLVIKTLTADALALPTLIFDEVDTGISGEAAKQVGLLLKELGQYHQIICITHQPQVAGKGDTHFYVYKKLENDKVKTRVKILSQEERIRAIAGMIGGENPSEAAITNATELLK